MPKNRLEAFSDGVVAIVITLLVLEIHVPARGQDTWRALIALLPSFAGYAISFLVCAVWWVAHHGLIHDLREVNRPLLWLNNLFLLFLVFLPFPTGLLGQNPGDRVAAALYGAVCTLTGLSFWLMRRYASLHPRLMNPEVPVAVRRKRLRISRRSPLLYLGGTLCSLWSPLVAICIYAAVPAYFAIAALSGEERQKNG